MITRPSTSRILEDIVEELMRDIMPSLTDPAQQIRLHMLTIVLNNCANASEREMIPAYVDFARDVAAATGNAGIAAAAEAARMGESLVLADVIADYQRASSAFADAMDLAMDTMDRDLIARGEDILRMRMDNERAILSGVSAVGRSAS
jgi:hypothetical protein